MFPNPNPKLGASNLFGTNPYKTQQVTHTPPTGTGTTTTTTLANQAHAVDDVHAAMKQKQAALTAQTQVVDPTLVQLADSNEEYNNLLLGIVQLFYPSDNLNSLNPKAIDYNHFIHAELRDRLPQLTTHFPGISKEKDMFKALEQALLAEAGSLTAGAWNIMRQAVRTHLATIYADPNQKKAKAPRNTRRTVTVQEPSTGKSDPHNVQLPTLSLPKSAFNPKQPPSTRSYPYSAVSLSMSTQPRVQAPYLPQAPRSAPQAARLHPVLSDQTMSPLYNAFAAATTEEITQFDSNDLNLVQAKDNKLHQVVRQFTWDLINAAAQEPAADQGLSFFLAHAHALANSIALYLSTWCRPGLPEEVQSKCRMAVRYYFSIHCSTIARIELANYVKNNKQLPDQFTAIDTLVGFLKAGAIWKTVGPEYMKTLTTGWRNRFFADVQETIVTEVQGQYEQGTLTAAQLGDYHQKICAFFGAPNGTLFLENLFPDLNTALSAAQDLGKPSVGTRITQSWQSFRSKDKIDTTLAHMDQRDAARAQSKAQILVLREVKRLLQAGPNAPVPHKKSSKPGSQPQQFEPLLHSSSSEEEELVSSKRKAPHHRTHRARRGARVTASDPSSQAAPVKKTKTRSAPTDNPGHVSFMGLSPAQQVCVTDQTTPDDYWDLFSYTQQRDIVRHLYGPHPEVANGLEQTLDANVSSSLLATIRTTMLKPLHSNDYSEGIDVKLGNQGEELLTLYYSRGNNIGEIQTGLKKFVDTLQTLPGDQHGVEEQRFWKLFVRQAEAAGLTLQAAAEQPKRGRGQPVPPVAIDLDWIVGNFYVGEYYTCAILAVESYLHSDDFKS